MQHWKFLLLGITGDLSKRKILPGLAQFAELNQNSVSVELLGYSRSIPDQLEIEDILNKHTTTSRHTLKSLSFTQGEYSDSTYFAKLIQSLKNDERLIVYVATPPVVFLDLLETFCPYNAYNLDIIIEKPFGQNLDEAKRILQKVEDCHLQKNIHYCDHYLFKNAAYLSVDILQSLQETKNKTLKRITVRALEEVDAHGRGGYYDANGAIKDMLPAHLYSLLNLGLSTMTRQTIDDYSHFQIKDVLLGQYDSYLQDIEKEESKTESYFKITCQNSIEMILESGKALGLKQTQLILEFTDGTEVLWNIDPKKYVMVSYAENQKIFNIIKDNKLDHTNMFEDLFYRRTDRFFIAENVLAGWEMYVQVSKYITTQNIRPITYQKGKWPIVG